MCPGYINGMKRTQKKQEHLWIFRTTALMYKDLVEDIPLHFKDFTAFNVNAGKNTQEAASCKYICTDTYYYI